MLYILIQFTKCAPSPAALAGRCETQPGYTSGVGERLRRRRARGSGSSAVSRWPRPPQSPETLHPFMHGEWSRRQASWSNALCRVACDALRLTVVNSHKRRLSLLSLRYHNIYSRYEVSRSCLTCPRVLGDLVFPFIHQWYVPSYQISMSLLTHNSPP